jgi:hypothetical protein
MKIKQKNKKELTFGDFVTAAYQNCGARQAANFVQFAIKTRQIVFQELPAHRPGGSMGRIKLVPKVELLAVVLGCASFANSGYGAEVIIGVPNVAVVVPAPPIVIAPDPGFFIFGGPYDGRRDARDYGRRGAESRGGDHRDGGRRR